MNLSYRSEIDGLRGLAIFLIFLSHFPDSYIKSGGVNIFFVLSGFLIAQIMHKKYSDNLIGFYSSRIKSLYPQLIIVSSIIFLFFLFFGEYEYIKRFYDSCKYAILGIVNIFFIRKKIAYGQESFLNPFGPFWAFSVIIQYYLTYGLLYKYFLKKDFLKFPIFFKLLALTLISYLIYIVVFLNFPNNPLVNFYSLLTRYWQFLAGASLFFYLQTNKISERLKDIFIILSFVILISWHLSEGFNLNFQLKTFLISLIGLLVIAASGNKNILNSFLSSKVLTQLGKISYPFYLWHMAFIYFAYLYLNEVNLIHKVAITCLVLFSSYFTLKLNNYLIKNKFIVSICLILILAISTIMQSYRTSISSYFISKNYINKINLIFEKDNPNIQPTEKLLKDESGKPCLSDELKLDCNFNHNHKNKVVLLGTSHMAVFTNHLTRELISKNYNVEVITRSGCPYLPSFYIKDDKSCNSESTNDLRNYLLRSKQATIVLIERLPLYLSGNYYTNSKNIRESDNKLQLLNDYNKSISEGLYESLNELVQYGHNLILVYPIPEFAENIPYYYMKNYITKKSLDLKEPRSFYDNRTQESFNVLDSLQSPNIERIYPSYYLCDNKYCYTKINNKILYSDDDHLNQNGVELIAPEIIGKIEKLSSAARTDF